MKYTNAENEIDNLLHSADLNAYERKLLRKTKRLMTARNEKINIHEDIFDQYKTANEALKDKNKDLEGELAYRNKRAKEDSEKIKKLEDREVHLLRDIRILNEEFEKKSAALSTEIKALKESLGRQRRMIGDYVGWAFFFGSVVGTTLFWVLK